MIRFRDLEKDDDLKLALRSKLLALAAEDLPLAHSSR